MMTTIRWSLGFWVFLALMGASVRAEETKPVVPPQKSLPLPGEVLSIRGHTAFVLAPPSTGKTIPWVLYAPTLPGLPGTEERWMFERFLEAGIAVAGIDVGESYGNAAGRVLYSALHEELTSHRKFAPKVMLLGRSRGGLMTLSWAAENPDKVAGFAGIYPVCNLASYPGITNAA
ncbi:MAG: alpha/beta hydrolase family protein, partial [Limisphaerales bacterium]